MKYLLLMYADESVGPKLSKEELEAASKTWAKFRQEIRTSGVLVSSSGVALPVHGNKDLKKGTQQALLKEGGLK